MKMIFERIREIFHTILTFGLRQEEDCGFEPNDEGSPKANPWTRDLERFNSYTREESVESISKEAKMQLLIEQARLEKAKAALAQQQAMLQMHTQQQAQQHLQQPAQQQRVTLGDSQATPRVKRRTHDVTLTDTKAWWGQAVATWDPEDAKNLGPQGEQRHPRQHKWFNQ